MLLCATLASRFRRTEASLFGTLPCVSLHLVLGSHPLRSFHNNSILNSAPTAPYDASILGIQYRVALFYKYIKRGKKKRTSAGSIFDSLS